MDNLKIGKAIKILGWVVVAYYAIFYLYATFQTLADASVRVYALIVVFEGLVHIAGGLFLVWLGRRISRNAEAPVTMTDGQSDS